MKKTIAIVTSMFFLFTTVFNGVSYANINTGNIMKMPEQEPFFSPVLGKITSSKYYDSDEIVINIQDLHCHAQTQRQISSILELLEKKYGINGVYLEGTYKEVNTSWLSGFNDGKQGSAIIEKMVEDGRLSGTEYYSLMNNKRDFIKPIEDEQLYKENIKLLNEIITNNQEVEIICNELEEQINTIKKSYSSDKAMKFEKLIKDFEAKKIDSRKYYQGLAKYAKEKNIDITKYANVELYIRLMKNNGGLNESKVAGELGKFLAEIKNKLSYQEYAGLLRKSDNFAKAENIADQLVSLNDKYQITKNLKLRNLESFINYLDFNNKINPVSFLEEEKALKEEIFLKLGRTKYEQEVAFLSDFISSIREYFTANISAQEYYRFEKEYKKFRTTWPSYFSVNTVKKLDKYQELLNKYHGNNLKRDQEFAKRIITKSNEKGSLIEKETNLAIEEIAKNIKNKTVKVVVTGGFHTRGLEKILEAKKISYAIITPKITGSIEQAKQIYWNTVIYNATILKNTINLEPLSQEAIDISFPKIMASVFEIAEQNLKNKNIKKDIEEFIDKNVIQKQAKSDKTEIVNWEIEGEIKADKTVYRVTYKDNTDNGRLSEKEYIYSNGETVAFSAINTEKTKQMLQKSKGREYAGPAILLEPGKSVRKQINKYVLEPLKSVSDGIFSFMDYEKLHMTVGYEPDLTSDFTEEELNKIKSLIGTPLRKTTFEGTLKLMPDGVIIYEIKDSGLAEQMYKLRDKLTQNSSYATPAIVHMTIGRLTDTSLLNNTPESKEKLAEILRKINEKIYEINKADKLSKIKIQNTVIYLSSAKERQVITQKAEPLSILKDLFKNTNKKLNLFSVTVFQPIAEEIVFRILPSIPLLITSFAITTNPALIIPAILTAITGTFIFSYSHTLADKITNKEQVRDWKSLLPKSILLTGVYLGLLILFPEQIILAPIVTIILHSLNNIASVITKKNITALDIIDNNDTDSSVPVIEQSLVDKLVSDISENFSFKKYDGLEEITQQLLNLPEGITERYDAFIEQIYILIEILKKYSETSYSPLATFGEEFIEIFVPFLTLTDKKGSNKMLFYSLVDSLFTNVGRRYNIMAESFALMKFSYSLNPDFVPYVVKKLISEKILNLEAGINRYENALKMGGDKLEKQFFLAVASTKELNKNLSQILKENIDVINKDIKPLITDEKNKQDVNDITSVLEELSDKINVESLPLLEKELNLLFEKAMELKDTDKNLSLQIIKTVLSISAQVLSETKDMSTKKINIRNIKPLLLEEYNSNPNSEIFRELVSLLMLMVKQKKNDGLDSFTKEVADILLNVALQIYEPISKNKIEDVTSEEYKNRKQQCLEIFSELTSRRIDDNKIFDVLFHKGFVYSVEGKNGPGLTTDTLNILINAAEQNDMVMDLPVPTEEAFISEDIEGLSDKVVDGINNLNPLEFIKSALSPLQEYSFRRKETDVKAKQLSVQIIEKLFDLAKSQDTEKKNTEKRKRAVSVLFDVAAEGIYHDTFKELSLDLDQIRNLALQFNLPLYLYPGDVSIENTSRKESYSEYSFTPLLKYLPALVTDQENPLTFREEKNLQTQETSVVKDIISLDSLNIKSPIITKITGKTDETREDVKQVLHRFEVLQKILEYNTSVLALLDSLKDSKKQEANMKALLKELKKMVEKLKEINEQHGNDAEFALNNIEKSLKEAILTDRDNIFRRHLLIDLWNDQTIREIKSVHTLINAIHQTAIADFKQEVGNVSSAGRAKAIQTITAKQKSTISGHNLSEEVNPNVVKFMNKLASRKFALDRIDDFVCKDELVVWTTKLNAHSVDILFNFGDTDRGIDIRYRERPVAQENLGKKERIRYFGEILEYLGFHVDKETQRSNGTESYILAAKLNKDFGLNDSMDLVDIAARVVEIFKFSTNVDFDLRTIKRTKSEEEYNEIFKQWLTKAKRKESWYGVASNDGDGTRNIYGYGMGGKNLGLLPDKRILNVDSLNNILDYLGCDLLPEGTTAEQLKDPRFLDKYFNRPIERAYVEGRIVVNENSVLVQKEEDIIFPIINEITGNNLEATLKSKIVNLVNGYDFNTKILANIGKYLFVSSVMNLKNGDKLFVKGIMNFNTKRMIYTIAERVGTTTRQNLTSEQLRQLLNNEGYDIPKPDQGKSRERKRRKELLLREIQRIESPNIPCMSTSEGTGVSVVGNITFNKDNVDENSILVVPFTSPDDVGYIEKAKGIITTGGGILSHAAITTREMQKPSVILNGAAWNENELEIFYNWASGDTDIIHYGKDTYHIQKVKTKTKQLKEGTRVLMNGETGMVLLFDDIDNSLLDEIQQYIDSDNAVAVSKFMKEHCKDENINRFAEYIYFQVAGNPNTPKTLNTFLSEDMPEEVKDKIKELNDGYVQDKIQSISEAIENVKSISNVNIIYNMHNELNKKMQIIRTIGDNKKIKTLKEQIRDIEKDNKKKLNYFMQTFINDSNNLIKKDNLSDDDIQNAILKIKLAEVYNYFANEAETDKLMLEKKKIIRNLIPKLRDKVNSSEIKDAALDLNKEVSLFEENAGNEKLFGSKTAQLAKMYKILSDIEGVTVPNGMGISVNILPMLFKTVGKENLLTDFEEAIKNKDEQKAKVLSKKICDLIDSKEFTGTELENGIKQRLSTFLRPGKKYSVRSSGVGEDATNNAFAGMGETKLNVKDEDIYENIKECWKSFFSERCIEYMISSGQIVKPAVLVQEMVNSEISGVVFSRDKYGNGTINAVLGQGEGIVSGMYSPDSILFDMSTGRVGEIIEYSVATKPFKIVTNPNGGVEQVAVGKNSKARALNTKQVKIIGEITKKLERYTNYPIDVEFSIEGDELYILQMRPITTLSAKNKEQSSDIEIPVIEQSVIDKTINLLSYWKENAKKAIKPIKDLKAFENIITQLSNLPEDPEQRYYAIVEQIYNLLDSLKKEHVFYIDGSVHHDDNPSIIFSETADEFGKFCSEKNLGGDSSWNKDIVSFSDFIPYLLAPFFNIKDIKNPEKTLFNSIVDYWFVEPKDRGEDVVLEEMATLINCVHSINPEYIPYIVDKLIEYEYISPEEQIDVKVSNKIGKSYDVLKEYYFAISSKEKVNKDLSKELKNAVKNIKSGLKKFTLNEQQQQKVTLSLSRLEEFSDKINDKNIPLMKNLINDLWDILSKENKEQTVIYMLPLLVCFAKGGKLADYFCIELKTDTIFKVLRSSYNVNSDNKLFYYILDELFDILRQLYVFDSENGNRKLSSEIAGNLLLALYAPIYENTLDINSSEYKEREKTFYTIFEKLTSEFPDNLNVFGYLFASSGKLIPETRNINEKYIFGPGLNKKTLQMYVNTVRKSDNRKIFVVLPVKDSDIRDIDELVNLFIDNFDLFNLTSLCNDLLTKKENGKKLAVAIVERLLEKIENKNIDPKEKQKILFMLVSMAISELYMSMQEYNFFDIDKLNELCKEYNLSYYLKSVTDSYVEFGKKTSTKGDYRLINLLKYLPKDMFGLNVVQEPPIIYRFNGETKNNDEKVEMTRKKFNTLQQALNDNTLALSLLDGLSKSKTPEKDMNELIDILSGMIKALSLINEEHGTAAQTALGNIVKTLYTQETFNWKNKNGKLNLNRIRQQLEIKTWKAEDLSKITEIHTLINAVHQTTISDFKDTIEDITDSNAIKTISATHQNTQYHSEHPEKTGIKIYDLSENEINPDIVNFIGKLSLMNLPYPRTDKTKPYYQINDFVCMDNFLVWTTRLYIHSVDIFINFAESDKTITIAFHESGSTTSNADRVKYFSAILKNLGFSVEANTETYTDTPCSLKAKISSNYGLSDDTDFVDVATKVISLFKYSDLLDFELAKYAKEGGSSYENTFNNLINKFMLGDIWYGYHPSEYAGWNDASLTAIPERWSLSSSGIKKILEYLGLATDNIPDKINQNDLNKYFNYAIERAFAVGRIVLKDGLMVKNENYDVISYLAKEISLNEEEAINKSELINFIPRNKFNFKTVGYIGDLIAVSGYLKLKDGNYLAVKGLINPATKRMDYSNVELVTFNGRKVVNADELSTILKEEGFDVSNREKISNTEQSRMRNLLHRQVQVTDTPEMRGVPTSSGNGTYVAGYITFNKNNVNENSVFVAPYTTPDDVESIKNAKAIITTSGGVLSHAAITTREYQKTSAIINGVNWHDDTLDVLYYSSTGEPFSSESLNIRKISERTKNLKEGSIVLLNGETGHILLFDDVDDKILKKLQTAVEKDDADKIKQIFVDNISNENIKKLVEYVYFQTIGDSRMPNTLNLLFSSDIPQVITDKIKELNEGYIQDKIIKINEAIENLKNIDNPNIAYSLIQMLTDKLAFIKTSETRKEIDTLKDKVIEKAEEVKDKLFVFLTALDKECKELNSKENLTQQDVNRIINIIQQANVYNMFVAENEERTELRNIKVQLKSDIELLESKVKKYTESKNKTGKQILSLDDINLDDVYMFGSKTTELAVIKKLLQGKENVVVPEGVGINNNTFEFFFEKTGQKEKFSILSNSFEQAIRDGNSELAQEFAQQIGDLIEAGKTEYKKTYELQRELSDIVLKTLGDTKYSVRSSGVGEDSANNAFAGMGETLLNVSKNNLFESLLTCWQSFYSERSIEYMINSKQIVRPAVLIQTMIDVEKAGVAFSRDKYGNATVETLYGLGEGIVSGKLTPDTITANMANGDVLEYSVATKNYKIVPSEDGVKTAFVGKGEKDRTLNYKEIKELIDVVKTLEKSAGYAVDIEFGFKDGKIFVLQRRPITTTVNNTATEQKDIKCSIQLSLGSVQEGQEVFVNIKNPLNEEESVPVYFEMEKTADGYSYNYIVDPKYASIIDLIREELVVRSNEDNVIKNKLNENLSVFAQAKEGEFEILPPLSDMLDPTAIEQTINVNINGIRNLLASA